ncbi:hypothetical protein BDV26DRAFT_265667 [Aspergillus bertholletiae]|uniref:ATP-grasp fold PylC-type domain-containing protein n=1 Tax=Aspergillus bertholletiae TaxID=1226010 RepID=A0A5N7B2T2_9EURO|nr:hypothetical protein BDV26DRAFT_265667 [Aspergillus bertholletiae]
MPRNKKKPKTPSDDAHSQQEKKPLRDVQPLPNVLLTNGRFPVALDLARQLTLAGCHVYCVDPMQYHICRFSRVVKASKVVPAPRSDPNGYVKGVVEAIHMWDIQLVIPIHEEEFCLAYAEEPEIQEKLFAPSWELLLRLHSKWEFSNMMQRFQLDVPNTHLCSCICDIENLDRSREWAIKPVFGRANTNVYHLRPGEPIPNIYITSKDQYIAQEWIYGTRYCSYSVFQHGSLQAHGTYPVLETIDGSSCVYFEACNHPKIKEYVERLAAQLFPLHGQIGLDFIETENRLVAIDCNPRATSGIHLWSKTPFLACTMIGRAEGVSIGPPHTLLGYEVQKEVLPGMLMWEHKNVTLKRYLRHIWRVIKAQDVVWNWLDLMPSLASPFLLTYYYKLCHRHKLTLPELFQWDLIWEPSDEQLNRLRSSQRRLVEDESEEAQPTHGEI